MPDLILSDNDAPHLPITNLNQLIETLQRAPVDKFFSVAKYIHISQKDVLPYATWSKTHHTRNCIALNDRFELILICWGPGQCTDVHDHGGEECWMYFVEGQFEEVVYGIEKSKLAVKKRKAASNGTLTYMADFMGVHSLQNIGDQRAFSLHLYAKPITSCHIFDPHSEQFTTKNLMYDTQVSLEQ